VVWSFVGEVLHELSVTAHMKRMRVLYILNDLVFTTGNCLCTKERNILRINFISDEY